MGAAPPPALRRVRGATTVSAALVLAGVLALLGWARLHPAGTAALPWTHTPLSQAGADPLDYAARVRAAVDDARRHARLAALPEAACAAPVAARRVDLLIGQRLEHAAFDDVLHACPGVHVVRENLSRAPVLPGTVVATWLGSPQQRADLLDPAVTTTAVACTHDGDDMLCVELLLGTG